ncbi:allophanate hydrolase [Halobacillus seohaensis]|uniref:Allophanate hydrolase n=1 Tax=Halobacillus seohaensis TaxID=447421 RepID=A0ABW2EMI0_9BACI
MGWLRENYQNGSTNPLEVVEEIIHRAQKNKDMNIWVTPPDMKWIKPYIDRLEALNPADAPLWGIPFAIKDNIDLAGVLTTAGCVEYGYTPNEHAIVVERLISAGAIPVGKANLDQFATGLVGTRSPYGEVHNALREELISGGSSAGSAVAVAKGQAVFSLGTDTAGSGRVPAALNNLVGYKPSLGAWSTKGVIPACESLDCVTVFSHSLTDALTVDGSARGEELSDPWSKKIPAPVYETPEKIYLPKDPLGFYGTYAEEYQEAWDAALEKIKQLNLPVEYIDTTLFSEAAEILYGGPWIAERWAALGEFIESHPDTAFPATEKVLRSGSEEKYDASTLFKAMHKLQALKKEAKNLLQNAVLVMPTCGGTWTREEVRENPISTNSDMGRYTNHCNLLDLSAVAIPAGEAAPDTPFGITLFSLSDQEGLITGTADWFIGKSFESQGEFKEDTTYLAVCGLHMRGYPLETQMQECGAEFIKEAVTAPKYQLIQIPSNPAKPGMIKQHQGGAAIQLEIWEMPLKSLGSFTTSIPAPLGIGKVELEDGTEVPGFICEGYAETVSEDITALGGWRQVKSLI